jgi:GH25 family lysozyme M1 (1,4-beta-N-acetylmuramidase)
MRRSLRAGTGVTIVLLVSALLAPAASADDGKSADRLGSPQRSRPVIRVLDAVALPGRNLLVGIDVSHWQGAIDWPTVHATGVSFAYIKASEGTTFVDDQYAAGRAQAAQAGIAVGAYHFARPSADPGDAIAQADHFLDTAAPQPGDLLPALDLEDDGGLPPDSLNLWTLEFVARIRERLGVAPMIYVSPDFWTANLGDSLVASGWGSPLWIAHWRTASPRIPAAGWQGRSWTIWQWSSRGLVSGIPGEVDLDVLAGRDLGVIRLP